MSSRLIRIVVTGVVFAGFSIPAGAQPATPPPAGDWCVTSPAMTESLKMRHQWRAARQLAIRSAHDDRVIERDGVFIVRADDSMLVNDDPLDLVGRTVRLQPDATGYSVETIPLSYRDDVGGVRVDFAGTSLSHERIDLPFAFPFHGQTYDHLYLTNRNGIYFGVPAPAVLNQYESFDAVAIEEPLISPLLLGNAPRTFVSPALHVNASSEEVVLTWRTDSTDFAYDVQTVLGSDGAIDLSWRSVRDVTWGAVVATPGLNQADMPREPVLKIDDELNDSYLPQPHMDLRSMEVQRLDGSDLLEIRLSLRGALDTGGIAPGEYLQYVIDSTAGQLSRIVVHFTNEDSWLLLPGRGWIQSPGSLRIEEDTIRFLVTDRDLEQGNTVELDTWIFDSVEGREIDSVKGTYAHSLSSDSFELDLSADSVRSVRRPLIESFTLPDMDPYAVWEVIRGRYAIDPEGLDALAIYQDFFTDLVLYAGAYSTVGNSGADGVSSRGGYGQDTPRSPALLHMSRLGYRYNTTDELSTHVLNHEFGHRWLYFFSISENGESTHSLNPAGAHPAQYVHTPAAFDVLGSRNSSAMGGSWFEDRGDGSFRARETLASYGYSWHELYLMGLASPEEVEPWYYIADSSPRLGDAYYPPDGIVVTGTRQNVAIGQVIDSMGARTPDHQTSKRRFSTYFVLLVRDFEGLEAGKIEDLQHRRQLLHEAIPRATGGRASIRTLYEEPGPRRRNTRRP